MSWAESEIEGLCGRKRSWTQAEVLSPLGIAYGAGPRPGEVVMLRISDIDSDRTLARVEQGKDRKDRYATLSPPAARTPALGGCNVPRKAGCSRAAIRCYRSRHGSSTVPVTWPQEQRASAH